MHQPSRRTTMSTRWFATAALGLAVVMFAGALSPIPGMAAEEGKAEKDGKAKGRGEGGRHGHFRAGRFGHHFGPGHFGGRFGHRFGPGHFSSRLDLTGEQREKLA